jgi:hypothetical protein
MPDSTAGNHRVFWPTIRAILLTALIAEAGVACRRKSSPSPPSLPATTTQSPSATQPSTKAPFYVLVWIESTPPGARVVRISDGFVLARTPETVELLQSKEPVPIRIELEGYVPVTREVSAASDGTVTVSLDPTPRGSAVRTKKSRRGRQ